MSPPCCLDAMIDFPRSFTGPVTVRLSLKLRLEGEGITKLAPQERWTRDVLERCQAFGLSSELQRLRGRGLEILGRGKLVTQDEWWEEMNGQGRMGSTEYLAFQRECGKTGTDFGLAPRTVEWMCLLEGYDPEEAVNVVEAQWPKIQVVTQSSNENFLGWLLYQAWELGLEVVQKDGSLTTPMMCFPYPQRPEEPLAPSQRPPLANAFRAIMEIPPGYPPEAAAELARHAAQLERELARQLGYEMPYRMRSSPLMARAAELRVSEDLSSDEIYDIVEEIHGEGDLSEDQKQRNKTKSQRNRVSKRLKDRGGETSLG